MKESEQRVPQLLAHAVLLDVEEFRLEDGDRMGTHVINLAGGDEKKAVELLEGLVSKGLLEKHVSDIVYGCPVCGATMLNVKLLCPKCHGMDLKKGNVLLNIGSSYVGLEDDFASAYIYTKEGEPTIEGTNHRTLSGYQCSTCGSSFYRPREKWLCVNCGKEFEPHEGVQKFSSSYKLTKLGVTTAESYSQVLREIVNVLLAQGMKVSLLGQLQGLSGAFHDFEIMAERDGTYVIDSCLFEEAKSIDLIKFFSLVHDSNSKGIFIAVPGIDSGAMEFISESGVSERLIVIEAPSTADVKQKLLKLLSS